MGAGIGMFGTGGIAECRLSVGTGQRASLFACRSESKEPTVGVAGANQTLQAIASTRIDGGRPGSCIDFVGENKKLALNNG